MSYSQDYDRLLRDFHASLQRGENPRLREYWSRFHGDDATKHELLLEMADAEIIHRVKTRQPVCWQHYAEEFEELRDDIPQLHALAQSMETHELAQWQNRMGTSASDDTQKHPYFAGFRGWDLCGAGGTGSVGRVYNVELERFEAIKLSHTGDPGQVAKIRREASAAAQLSHVNLCPVYGIVPHDGGLAIRMEYIDGKTIDDWALDKSKRSIAAKLSKVASALDHMHKSTGLIHRDIKPGNILIRQDDEGSPVVVDFGFAVVPRSLKDESTARTIAGTPDYMAPEQAEGRTDLQPSVDTYALGVALYSLCTGQRPFDGGQSIVLRMKQALSRSQQVHTLDASTLNDPDLQAICELATARLPASRYKSAADLGEDLLRYSYGLPPLHARVSRYRRLKSWLRQRRAPLAICLLAVISIAMLGLFAAKLHRDHVRKRLVESITNEWRSSHLTPEVLDRIERQLNELEKLDLLQSVALRQEYLDNVLQSKSATSGRLSSSELKRIDRIVSRLSNVSSNATIATHERWEQFRRLAAPYTHSTSLYFLFRPDRERIPNLERVARIQRHLAPTGASAGVRFELFRAYVVDNRLLEGKEVAEELLEERSLSPLWRVNTLRDYVWLAAQLHDPDILSRAEKLADDALKNSGTEPIYLSMYVEKARIQAMRNLFFEAEETLEIYFRLIDEGKIDLRFDEEPITYQDADSPRDNIVAAMFLDASILKGFLLERQGKSARDAWSSAYALCHGTRVGTYYEGAVLGSLCRDISREDALEMVLQTEKGAAIQGPTPAMARLRAEIWKTSSIPRVSVAISLTTSILNRSWSSDRGHDFAREIAFRELSFAEFSTLQIRLWLYETLTIAVAGPRGKEDRLTPQQKDFLWEFVDEACRDFRSGALAEATIVDLVLLGVGDKELKDFQIIAAGVPEKLRASIGYILSRQFELNLNRLADGQQLLGFARDNIAESYSPQSIENLIAQ